MAAARDKSSPPDMTPVLDLVMQLLMYLIVCAHFLGQEVSDELVSLPDSSTAVPLDKKEGDILFVNVTVNKDRPIVIFGKDPLNLGEFEFEMDKLMGMAPKDGEGKILTTVIIRADTRSQYGNVWRVLNICKKKNFRHFTMRLNLKN